MKFDRHLVTPGVLLVSSGFCWRRREESLTPFRIPHFAFRISQSLLTSAPTGEDAA
jgi:hypothetical protein